MMTGPAGGFGSTGPNNHPGHADQKSHGRKKGSGDFEERAKSAASDRAALDAAPADRRMSHEGQRKDALQLDAAQRAALDDYTSDAQEINAAIRSRRLTPEQAETVSQIDSVMTQSRLGSDVVTWRGLNSESTLIDGSADGDLTGLTWKEAAFVSTSADRRIAEGFAGMFNSNDPVVVMRVLTPKGTGAATLSSWGSGSPFDAQAEVLLDRGLSMSVAADHGVVPHPMIPGGVRLLDIMATPAAPPVDYALLILNAARIDLAEVQRQFEQRLDDLLQRWTDISARQRDEIVDQVRSAVTSNDLAALSSIHTSTAEAAEALTEAMTDMALEAAREMSREAGRQGVRVDPVASDGSEFSAVATALAALLAQGLTNAAGREALRQWSYSTSGDEVAAAVREHLDSLSTSFVESHLGMALTSAQNTGRLNTALSGPSVALYASEVMDRNTCRPCREVDGKWLGNSDDPDTPARVAEVYPNGGYRYCEGGVRCRGTVIAVYRPEQVGPNGEDG